MNISGSSLHSLYTRWREIQNPTTIMRTAFESVNTQVIVWTTGFTHTCYERSSRNVACCCMSWGAIGLKTDHAPLCLSLLLILLAWLDVNVHDGDGDMITDWSQEVSHSVCLFYSNPLQANTTDCCIEYRVSVQFGGIGELLYMYVYGRQTKIRSRGLSVYKEEGNLHTPCH